MVFGREVLLPMAVVIGTPEEETSSPVEDTESYVQSLKSKIQSAHNIARNNLKKAVVYRKGHYDIKSEFRRLEAGQAVCLYDLAKRSRVDTKLTPKWNGPFLIVRRIDDLTYFVKNGILKKPKVYHIDHLMK
ncbi:hypothetical protein DPMN_048194 [Dreissena polymorpha]|uniref:Integrase p58-like C-terminal domain-containing protein n=1 Tax=Dreissena polymorpha TaxID=45954 RepID=A0A9D4DB45_DREPO|nr:hypothetical protein DPMN_048194 [Dreissena polymorpha]